MHSRRQFLHRTLVAAATPGLPTLGKTNESFWFFVVGDTHFLADAAQPDRLQGASDKVTQALVETLNHLPGTAIPEQAGGGTVGVPEGLIHCGDLIDSGDKSDPSFAAMQATEWAAYDRSFGLTGSEGKLRMPVMEVYGNHDAPEGHEWVLGKLAERTARRRGLARVSDNGLHYSWDWHGLHFVNLGIVVGGNTPARGRRRYDPKGSLEFLRHDLKVHAESSSRPVIITHHIDVLGWSAPANPLSPVPNLRWDGADIQEYYDTLLGHPILAIFHGHTHNRNIFRWDGTLNGRAGAGFPTFNVDNGSHFKSDTQGLFVVEVRADTLLVRELTTPDRWKTQVWTPQVWTA